MESILVTGGAGNIGSALVRALVKRPATEVIVADNLLTGSVEKIKLNACNLAFIKCDVNDFDDISSLFYRFRFTHVFHFAAVVGVQRTLANPLLVLRDITGIENVLRLCKNTGVKRIYFSSSSEVYGEPFEIPQNESTTPLNSRLPYAVVKNLGEVYLRTFQREFGLPYTIFRFFNTYGPGQALSNPYTGVAAIFASRLMNNTAPLVFEDGHQSRDFVHVYDVVAGLVAALETENADYQAINLGSGQATTIVNVAQKLASDLGVTIAPQITGKYRKGDIRHCYADITKASELLGYSPTVALEDGIRDLVGWVGTQVARDGVDAATIELAERGLTT